MRFFRLVQSGRPASGHSKRTAIPKPHDLGFCLGPDGFFAAAAPVLLCSGHQVATRTDTASPAAKMFLLALISRSW